MPLAPGPQSLESRLQGGGGEQLRRKGANAAEPVPKALFRSRYPGHPLTKPRFDLREEARCVENVLGGGWVARNGIMEACWDVHQRLRHSQERGVTSWLVSWEVMGADALQRPRQSNLERLK